MPIVLFYIGTLACFAAAGIAWGAADWCVSEAWNGGPAMPFWLLLSGGLTVLACLMFVAFIANVVDILSLVWRENRKGVSHDL